VDTLIPDNGVFKDRV